MPIWNRENRLREKMYGVVVGIRSMLKGNQRRERTQDEVFIEENDRVLNSIREKIKERFYTFEESAQDFIHDNRLDSLLVAIAQKHELPGSPEFAFTTPEIWLDRLREEYPEVMEKILMDSKTDMISDQFIDGIIEDFAVVPTMRVELGDPMAEKHLIINIFPEGSSFRLRFIRKGFEEVETLYNIQGEEVSVENLLSDLRKMADTSNP